LLFGCGYYPESAESEKDEQIKKITAAINEAAIMITNEGEQVFPEFRKKTANGFKMISIFLFMILKVTG